MKWKIEQIPLVLCGGLIMFTHFTGLAQGASPPPDPLEKQQLSEKKRPDGGNAILGSGVVMLFSMGIGYIILKTSANRKQSEEE